MSLEGAPNTNQFEHLTNPIDFKGDITPMPESREERMTIAAKLAELFYAVEGEGK